MELTFQYYKNVYCGRKIKDEYDFCPILLLAKSYMGKYTCQNANPDFSAEETKNCLCEICDILYTKKEQEALDSESFDTFTKKYKSVEWEQQILSVMSLYLPQNLLYRGVEQNA